MEFEDAARLVRRLGSIAFFPRDTEARVPIGQWLMATFPDVRSAEEFVTIAVQVTEKFHGLYGLKKIAARMGDHARLKVGGKPGCGICGGSGRIQPGGDNTPWGAIKRRLAEQMSETSYRNWIHLTTGLSVDGRYLTVAVPDAGTALFLKDEYQERLEAAAIEFGIERVTFAVSDRSQLCECTKEGASAAA